MNKRTYRKRQFFEATLLVLFGGLLLFSAGFFLSENIDLQASIAIACFLGYIATIRIGGWTLTGFFNSDWVTIITLILMSAWASICILAACYFFSYPAFCTDNWIQGLVIVFFVFPMFPLVGKWLLAILATR